MIRIEGVFKKYGKTPILHDLNINVKKASITGIIGKSGAGKTTALRLMNGLVCPDQGKVLVQGQDLASLNIQELRALRKKMGMIFQSFNLLENATVFDNIALGLNISKTSHIHKRVKEVANLVGLFPHLNKYPSHLSGGQKQRVAIARVLALEPQVILCDEFTSALDPETTLDILNLIDTLYKKLNLTMVFITHDMGVVRELCQYLYVMDQGTIVEEGPMEEVFYAPKHEATKSLLCKTFDLDIPTPIKEKLGQTPSNTRLVQLIFSQESAQQPVIFELVRQFNVPLSVVSGQLDHVGSKTLGHLLITLMGSDEQWLKVQGFLTVHKVAVHVLGFLP